uniref:WD repeat-containing protein 18 n=1 Tax=Anopheles farauti TaxID=69004 RepID=A0A182Q5I6_9DIPT
MTDCVEIALTSATSAQHWSCCAWDVRTGTQLMTYRAGGPPGPNTLHTINNEYVVAGNLTKPMLTFWPINRQEPSNVKYMLPAVPGALAISPDGNYCIVAHAHSFNVYNLATGVNLASVGHHYGTISVLRFTDDSSHFVSAAHDCRIVVWSLSETVQAKDSKILYELSDFTLPVTDVHIGKGGMKALLAAVSLDRSCKLYEIATGRMLLNVVFPVALGVLTLNPLETELFVGDKNGQIYGCHLQSVPRSKEVHLQKDLLQRSVFRGHKKSITCLSASMDNETLLSGSEDETVIVWHVQTRQQLKLIPHKGTITNAFFLITPRAMFDPSQTLTVPFPPFEKTVSTRKDRERMTLELVVSAKRPLRERIGHRKDDLQYQTDAPTVVEPGDSDKDWKLKQLEREIQNLNRINQQLYKESLRALVDVVDQK